MSRSGNWVFIDPDLRCEKSGYKVCMFAWRGDYDSTCRNFFDFTKVHFHIPDLFFSLENEQVVSLAAVCLKWSLVKSCKKFRRHVDVANDVSWEVETIFSLGHSHTKFTATRLECYFLNN